MLHALRRAWRRVRGRRAVEPVDAAVDLRDTVTDTADTAAPIGGDELRIRAQIARAGGVL